MLTKKSKIRKACQNSDYLTVKTILNKGFDINVDYSEYHMSETLMDYAIVELDVRMINLLLERGFDLSKSDNPFCSISDYFRRSRDLDIPLLRKVVEIFVKQGVDINQPRSRLFSNNALIYAAERNNLKLVELFLEFGADKNIENDQGKRAIDCTDSYAIKELLKDDYKLEKIAEDGWHKLSKYRVAHVKSDVKLGRAITEIFNFSSKNGNVITTITNLRTDAESSVKEYMDDYQDKPRLEEAFENLGPLSEKALRRITPNPVVEGDKKNKTEGILIR